MQVKVECYFYHSECKVRNVAENSVNIFSDLINKSSDLQFIMGVTAVTMRAAKKFKSCLSRKVPLPDTSCWISNDLPQRGRDGQAMKLIETCIGVRMFQVVSSTEIEDALLVLISQEQLKENNLLKTKKHMMLKLVNRDCQMGLM